VSLSIFLQALFDHGRVRVAAPTEKVSTQDLRAAEEALREQDAASRLEGPGGLPELDMAIALWGAKTFHGACQLVVFRQLDEQAIAELLPPAQAHGNPQSSHWSADLTLRFLPDLLRQASAISEEDPLVRNLRSLAYQWPLSSVGIEGVNPEHVDELSASPALLQLYVDRILARKDFPRLKDPAVREAARKSVGIHAELWPDLTKYFDPVPSPLERGLG
jgi:hypothetical protein